MNSIIKSTILSVAIFLSSYAVCFAVTTPTITNYAKDSDSVTIYWNAVPDADIATYIFYVFQYKGSGVPSRVTEAEIEVGNVTSYDWVFPPGKGGSYNFGLKARNTSGQLSGLSGEWQINVGAFISATAETAIEAEYDVNETSIFCPGYNPALFCCGNCGRKWEKTAVDARNVVRAGSGANGDGCHSVDEGMLYFLDVEQAGTYTMRLLLNSPNGTATDEVFYYNGNLGWNTSPPTGCLDKLQAISSGPGVWTEPAASIYLSSGLRSIYLFIADSSVSIDKIKFIKNAVINARPSCNGVTPVCIAGTNAEDPNINISWSACTDAEGDALNYAVYRDTADAIDIEDTAFYTPSLSYANSGLPVSTKYYYGLRACDAYGCSNITPSCNATTLSGPPPPPEYTVLKIANPPVIDGNLTEYAGANSITLTTLGGNTSIIKTLWDNTALYLAANVTDTQLNAIITSRDGSIWDEDSVEWAIDTQNNDGGSANKDSAYMLADDYHGIINILNAVYDSQGSVSGTSSSSWNGAWTSATKISGTNNNNADADTGYTVEIKIPWSLIGLAVPPANNAVMALGLLLNDKDASGVTRATWNNTNQSFENAANWSQVLFSSPADVNNDTKVNIKDIQICIKAIVAPGSFTTPDQLNQLARCKAVAPPEITVNIKDIQEIIKAIIGR